MNEFEGITSERDQKRVRRFMDRLATRPRPMRSEGSVAIDGGGGAAYVMTNKGARRVVQFEDGEPVFLAAFSKQQQKDIKRASKKSLKKARKT